MVKSTVLNFFLVGIISVRNIMVIVEPKLSVNKKTNKFGEICVALAA